ncbi:nuclear envelope integral membrane protein 1 [Copidosoma floridanum]|uniref:nuclear envelope integral membrane protein 1 n=1 Tax=Copidosoma floridanum TaxID=29053 RepID=UPI0006C9E418|nr:nuclear envelope integral membrane protein 1 [Copidosoma floridanum]
MRCIPGRSVIAVLTVILAVVRSGRASLYDKESVYFMEPGEYISNDKPGLSIFCHNANSKYIMNFWRTIVISLKTNLETYELYEGMSPHEVVEKHEDNQKYWRFSLFNAKKSKQFRINPFENSCIGVYMNKKLNQFQYKMVMSENNLDSWKVSMMVLGVFLFWSAQRLSRNTVFYYASGITFGVTLSFVALIYIIGKLLPKGKFMYLMMATGYTMSFYVAQMIWENAQLIAIQYRDYVVYYILTTALTSFIICYRFGPVTNPRTKNIIQWVLQIIGLILVYHSSYFREASTAVCVILVVFYNFPTVVFRKGHTYWKHMFPDQRRLLTDDEYRKEAERETFKALSGLKEYCHSPKCDPWKTVLKLKDPVRFAKFVEGNSHLSENESMDHDAELTRLIEECECTDDEPSDED